MIALDFDGTLCISIHALLAESDCVRLIQCYKQVEFLSTLSLRRATLGRQGRGRGDHYFYPRSPCGERRFGCADQLTVKIISIHALLAESDPSILTPFRASRLFLSTLSLRRATAIHRIYLEEIFRFLSTLSLRRATSTIPPRASSVFTFLSTLSLRRATL